MMETSRNDQQSMVVPSSSSAQIMLQEETLMKYFSGMIQASFGTPQSTKRTNGQIRVHWRVSSTAIVFFRQFYLKNDLLQHDPRIVMLATVFLAGKIEECRVSIKDLLQVYDKCTDENIKACELLVIESVDFKFSVKHPQSIVHTLIADFKRISAEVTCNGGSGISKHVGDSEFSTSSAMDVEEGALDRESNARREWAIAAEAALIVLQLSNAALLFSPLVVAVCALKATQPDGVFSTSLDSCLFRRFGEAAGALLDNFAAIESMLEIAKAPIDMTFLKNVCMERLKKESVWSKAKVKKSKSIPASD